ncbi:hypothetical protein DESPIG_00995 [Desulfovibrio piger ATCC 29098]|uniref:Uncharacterized protein n=1 Tax=Desulfovibrio piger ATCC 29098 TaxID=411464 RepID=B6WSK6_9BACT|nr:hypothetical protein DESPIG_00995 [Desulfovibrio piger ATCC 29098]
MFDLLKRYLIFIDLTIQAFRMIFYSQTLGQPLRIARPARR